MAVLSYSCFVKIKILSREALNAHSEQYLLISQAINESVLKAGKEELEKLQHTIDILEWQNAQLDKAVISLNEGRNTLQFTNQEGS